MASWTVRIFSASSSLILTLNSSSSDMISSTRSRESAFRSSMKFASGVTSSSLTLSCSAMIFFRRSSALVAISTQSPFRERMGNTRLGHSLPARARLNRSPEDAIDEFGRGFATEELGQFDRLVDCGPERHCSIAVQGFIESDAQNVAIDRRHLRQRPQRRSLLDHLVDRRPIGEHATYQLLRVTRRVVQ